MGHTISHGYMYVMLIKCLSLSSCVLSSLAPPPFSLHSGLRASIGFRSTLTSIHFINIPSPHLHPHTPPRKLSASEFRLNSDSHHPSVSHSSSGGHHAPALQDSHHAAHSGMKSNISRKNSRSMSHHSPIHHSPNLLPDATNISLMDVEMVSLSSSPQSEDGGPGGISEDDTDRLIQIDNNSGINDAPRLFGFFMLNSYLEEFLFKAIPDFHYGWYMTAFELLCFTVFAMIERHVATYEQYISIVNNLSHGEHPSIFQHHAPLLRHLWVAVCMTASRGLTNVSLQYLNYPTQVIFKSMKLITVMIGSLFILKSRFTLYEYSSALALVLSAILFSLGDVDAMPNYNTLGVIIVLLSLVADALHSNTQESLLKEHGAGILEAMLYTNLFASSLSWVYVFISGEFFPAFWYCYDYSTAYVIFILRAMVIYLGVLCFVLMINTSGVVSATAITTIRKILSIIVSFILFPKPLSFKHVWGFFLFCFGVAISIWEKMQQQRTLQA